MYPELVDIEMAKTLDSYSLTYENLDKWLEGNDITLKMLPFGYAGNPKGYEAVSKMAKELIEVQVNAICENM